MAIPRRSPYHKILEEFFKGEYLLCVSNEVVLEYEEILISKVGAVVANNIINAILASQYTVFINPQNRYHLIESDPDDNKKAFIFYSHQAVSCPNSPYLYR